MTSYPARFSKEEDGSYFIQFRTYTIFYQNPDFMPIARDPETRSG